MNGDRGTITAMDVLVLLAIFALALWLVRTY